MQFRLLRLRWRRRVRKSQRQAEDIGSAAEETIDKHLLKRFDRLLPVRRFVLSWIGLVLLLMALVFAQNLSLSGYYQLLKTVPGGIYNEGLQGSFTNANPIYATSEADSTVSRLIFAGLFKVDDQGHLAPDLASGYTVDGTEKQYTVHLKHGLKWQDGSPLTAEDVAFTFHTIQDPDAQSPLFNDWSGIDVSSPDDYTIVFKLPDVLASFPYNLTVGILPEHLLSNIPASDLRSADFNTVHPIGAGPFEWQAINVSGNGADNEQVEVGLKAFPGYNGGTPKLDAFTVQIFSNEQQLETAFKNKDLTAMAADDPPPLSFQNRPGVVGHNFILRAATMVFFKTSADGGVLSDSAVRQALVQSANVPEIINSLGYTTREVNEPILAGQLGYNPSYAQAKFDLSAAKTKLSSDGWTQSKDGSWTKGGQNLNFTLTAADTAENHKVTSELINQWKQLGANVTVQFLDPTDFLSAISYHNYQAVLTSITVGTDPDVFVYWDSSQADVRSASRLNLSEYSSTNADLSLEAGRTRLNPAERVIKYGPFLQAWQQDNPALGLYQPRFLYLTNGPVGGLDMQTLTSATDRFYNVQNWEIRQAKVTR
jgi:peptide/nickel transport system substrate-binding protein